MMNKLTALFAMVIGLSLVADVNAAGRRNPRRGAAPAADVAAPAADVAAPAADVAAPKGDKKAEEDTPGFFARRKQNLVDATEWAKAHPYKTAGITAGTLAAAVIAVEAARNGKNSWLPRAYRAMFAKNSHSRLADVIKAKEAAKAA